MSSESTSELFKKNEIRINKLFSKGYILACLVPLFVFTMTVTGLFNFSLGLATFGLCYSIGLGLVFIFLLNKKYYKSSFKYIANIAIQGITFIYSTDVDLAVTIMYMTGPLFALLYFDPKLEFVSCIISIISMIIGIVIMAPEAAPHLYIPVTPLFFILTTGGAYLLEMIFGSGLLMAATIIARKMMILVYSNGNRIASMQNDLIFSFADMIESRDGTTGEHVKRTSKTVAYMIEYISKHKEEYKINLSDKEMEMIAVAAPLHDIGKMKVPDAILSKPGKLEPWEFEIIKTHSEEGAKIIDKTMTNIEDPMFVRIAREMALNHHEKWNGAGYPYGLKGEEIPVSARIMAVADVFDALCSKRSYKDAFSIDDAYKIMEDSKDTHFEASLVDILKNLRNEMELIYCGE